jgi:hypothetical protein
MKKIKMVIAQGVFRIVKEEIISFKDDFRDIVMVLACALSN